MMRKTNCPVVMDATHSAQKPSTLSSGTGGQREMVPVIARAAIATGVSGLFMETHPEPEKAPCDSANMWPLGKMRELLETLKELDQVTKSKRFLEDDFA